MRRALITGITGQDGSYLAEYLLSLGYQVYGLLRRVAVEDPECRFSRVTDLIGTVEFCYGSLENFASLITTLLDVVPHEVYHLAAQSDVRTSFADPFSTMQINVDGTHHVLEAIRLTCPRAKVYFAGSSEMFGNAPAPQSESTPLSPVSPYGISKVAGFHLAHHYRQTYDMYVSCGILFNHESPRRGHEFVTRKITKAVGQIKHGHPRELKLGNLDAERDWGHAEDYVRAMHQMLQLDASDDFVIATGQTRSVRQFCEAAFAYVDLDWSEFVTIHDDLLRPTEVNRLVGDCAKAKRVLGWEPRRSFSDLVREMVQADVALVGAKS